MDKSPSRSGIPVPATIALRVGALVLAALGIRWIYLYTFTDYRHQLAGYYVGASLLVLAFAVGLWLRVIWVAGVSVVAAFLFLGACLWLIANGAAGNPVLWIAGLVALAYMAGLYSYFVGTRLGRGGL